MRLIIKISREDYKRINEIAKEIEGKGVTITKTLDAIGCIFAEASAPDIQELEKISGVSLVVEDAKDFKLI
jgi:hypothetical protein